VLAGTPAIMLLVQRGKVSLDAPVSTYIPEYTGDKGRSPCAN
jgi:CubicO group peptidase (beta-lactamase class C family)